MGKKALILSGGSIRGAFQAGAIQTLFQQNYHPDIILGISVGALNASYIVNKIGELNNDFDWNFIADDLVNFWKTKAHSPENLVRRYSFIQLAFQLLTKRFKSLLDVRPLHNIIRQTLKIEYLRRSQTKLIVGAVNLFSGQIEYFDSHNDNIIEAVIASGIIPLIMPYHYINGVPYVDGGVRDVVPTTPLLDSHDISELAIIICHPQQLDYWKFNPGSFIKYADRTKNITVNEIIKNDLLQIQILNAKRENKIKYKIIRPEHELRVMLDKFTYNDILQMIQLGQKAAENAHWQLL
jgi:NTE family protein